MVLREAAEDREEEAPELAGLSAPVMVIGADEDVFFPGEALLERSRALFSNLVAAELLEQCCHVPPMDEDFTARLLAMLDGFLQTHIAGGASAP